MAAEGKDYTTKYGGRELDGIFRMNWMLKPKTAVGCKVKPSALEAGTDFSFKHVPKWRLNARIGEALTLFGIVWPVSYHILTVFPDHQDGDENGADMFGGVIALGIIVIDLARRTTGPHVSDIALALYKQYFPIESLKRILFCDVRNEETVHLVEQIYEEHGGQMAEGIMKWPQPQSEYLALLTTPVGKIAESVVLGAWPRGARYLSDVRTDCTMLGTPGKNNRLIHMLFEISDVPFELPSLSLEVTEALLGEATFGRDVGQSSLKKRKAEEDPVQSPGQEVRTESLKIFKSEPVDPETGEPFSEPNKKLARQPTQPLPRGPPPNTKWTQRNLRAYRHWQRSLKKAREMGLK
ncbi:hypothetical protein N7466_004797 [Penicillium verhagenii]|uniref:uncharacterized protein n=1 Tax=Penicillium verhagenii TaxID=1562060 RepID=UPI002544DF2B|nr:uncharacterized protein N7466_004797 [Penicillium verhagenii]KAJ5935250.1 hypothetical protein N7466_004797 [Penicillium verhagenii]